MIATARGNGGALDAEQVFALADALEDVLNAADEVVRCWSRRDLAAAVRELAAVSGQD
jgi:hypothetical protein